MHQYPHHAVTFGAGNSAHNMSQVQPETVDEFSSPSRSKPSRAGKRWFQPTAVGPASSGHSFSDFPDEKSPASWTSRLRGWVGSHRILAGILFFLALAGLVLVAVLPPVCVLKGCPAKESKSGASLVFEPNGVTRVLVSFKMPNISALAQVPAILRRYTSSVVLSSSGLQILSFDTEDVLQEVKPYLQKHPELELLVRDTLRSGFVPPTATIDDSKQLSSILLKLPQDTTARAASILTSLGLTEDSLNVLLAQAANAGVNIDITSGRRLQQLPQSELSMQAQQQQLGMSDLDGQQQEEMHQGLSRRLQAGGGGSRRGSSSGNRDTDLGPDDAADFDAQHRRQLLQSMVLPAARLNDANFSQQWHHSTLMDAYTWAAVPATVSGTTSKAVIVAVIDSGADMLHPDLKNNMWINEGEIPGNGIDDDGNGYIDDVYGWDFAGGCTKRDPVSKLCTVSCTGSSNPQGYVSHGTHCAGLVGAVQNNMVGGSGVAPNVRLMILKVSDCNDLSRAAQATSDVLAALDYAYRMGAHVVSMSLGRSDYKNGFYPYTPPSIWQTQDTPLYVKAMQPLADKGVLVVAAAGNEQLDMDNLNSLNWPYNPCLVPLPNVVCVASVDSQDNLSSFSNFGSKTVHVAAPGNAILSTIIGGYGLLSGTSMACPIVAGTAALALSVLGAADGNYFRATEVKALLMGSGDSVPALPVISRRRVNSFSTVLAAAQAAARASSNGSVPLVAPVAFNSSQASVQLSVFTETYYALPNYTTQTGVTVGLASANLTAVDSTIRSATPTAFSNFKYGLGFVTSLTALLNVTTPGLYSIRVVSAAPQRSWRVLVGGQVLAFQIGAVGSAGWTGAILLNSAGFYNFELRIANAATLFDIKLRPPTSNATYTYPAAGTFITATTSNVATPATVPDILLSSGFQLWYNTTNATAVAPGANPTTSTASNSLLTRNLSPDQLSPASGIFYRSYAIIDDLAYTDAGAWQNTLQPPIVNVTGAATAHGVVIGRLLPDDSTTSMQLSMSCTGSCSLHLNGLLVLDMWASKADAALAAPPVQRGTSACVSLPSGVPVNVALWFSTPLSSESTLSLTWAPCDGSWEDPGSLVYWLLSSTFWRPQDVYSALAGYIGGLQCDVWRGLQSLPTHGAPSSIGGAAPPTLPLPTYRLRLPVAPSNQRVETLASTWSTRWNFTLDALLPGLATQFPPPFTVPTRVVSFLDGADSISTPDMSGSSSSSNGSVASIIDDVSSFNQGADDESDLRAVRQRPPPRSPPPAPSFSSGSVFSVRCWTYWSASLGRGGLAVTPSVVSSAFLAGQQVLLPGPFNRTSYVPNASSLNGYSQLLAIEWANVTATTVMAVAADTGGGAVGTTTPVTVDLSSMTLPVAMLPSTEYDTIGTAGLVSQSYLPSPLDVPSLVLNDLAGCTKSFTASLPVQGLDTNVQYARLQRGKVQYMVTDGFVAAPAGDLYMFSVVDGANQTSSLRFGGVTVKNAAVPFRNTSSSATYTFEVYIPGGLVPSTMTIKAATADASALYNVTILAPSDMAGPVDVNSYWSSPQNASYVG